MLMLLDEPGLRLLSELTGSNGARYYLAEGYLAQVVAENGVKLGLGMSGQIGDVVLGEFTGTVGMVLDKNIGKKHWRVTVRRIVRSNCYDWKLSEHLRRAPRR